MSTSKHFDAIAVIFVLLALITSICMALTWQNVDNSSAVTVSKNDLAHITEYINLDNQSGEINIAAGGTYQITGTLSEGRIVVDVDDSESVILILAGTDISCSDGSAIYVANSGSCTVYLQEGTENIVSSGTKRQINKKENNEDADGGALLLKDSATICGDGSLAVYGYINNGIHCSNDLYIESGTISVTAVNNGIKGKDSLTVDGGNLSIAAGNAGLKSGESGDSNSGTITINDGQIDISQSYEGMEANQITLNDGVTRITASDDGINACGGSNSMGLGLGGQATTKHDDKGNKEKAGRKNEMPEGDKLSGKAEMPEADKPSDKAEIPEGDKPSGKAEMSEADKPSNKAAIPEADSFSERPEMDSAIDAEASEDETVMPNLTINGGYLYILAGGDGLDSNGNLTVNGGTVIVDGPSNDGNGALDSGSENGGKLLVNGGTLIAVGGAGMAEEPEDESEQNYISCKAEFNAGDRIAISDTDGNILFEYNAAKSGDFVIFSSPDLQTGSSYTVSIADKINVVYCVYHISDEIDSQTN